MKIAIFLPNWLGDLVMATPALRAIRHQFGPSARLVGVMRPYLADVLSGTHWLTEQWYYDPRSRDRSLRSWSLARRIRRERFDVALFLTNSLRPALTAWLGRAKERIGYVRNGRGPLLTGKLYAPCIDGRPIDSPVVEIYLALAHAIGCTSQSPHLELATTEAQQHSADAVRRNLGLRADGRVVTLNSGSSNGEARSWPIERFGELARRIACHSDHDVLVMCGPNEREAARAIVREAAHPRVFSMADQPLDLGTSKACIRAGRLMVSTDSGPRHVAAAFGKPVITLFGPTPPIWSENPTVQSVDLRLDLDCIGCRGRVCSLGHHKCMHELTVDAVYAQVTKLLEKESPSIAA